MTKNLLFPLVLAFIASINFSHAQMHMSARKFTPLNETFEVEREKIKQEWRTMNVITDSRPLKSYQEFLLTKASAAKIEHIFNFNNPIMLEPFSSLDEFLEYLAVYKPHLLGAEGDARAFFAKLEDWLTTIETYQRAGVDLWMAGDKGEATVISAGGGASAGAGAGASVGTGAGGPPTTTSKISKISKLELDPVGFKVVMDSHNFASMLEVLNKKDPTHQQLIDLYNKLVADETLLHMTGYPDPLDNPTGGACVPLVQKKSHLAAFFNELTGLTGAGGPDSKLIDTGGGDVSHFASRYAGMSPEYKSELLYKMKAAALEILKKMETAPSVSDYAVASSIEENKKADVDKKDRLQTLLQGFLNAGKHCPDAKKQWVAGELFPVYCPDLQQSLNDSLYPRTDLFSQGYLVAARLKQESFEKYLAKNINMSAAEAATTYAATWDRLAPVLGLPLKKGAYATWAKVGLKADGFLEDYTAELLWKTYRIENADRYQMELGALFDFKGEKFNDFLAAAELQRLGLLHRGQVQNATELEVMKEYPALGNLRAGLLTTTPEEDLIRYQQIMVIHGVLRGDTQLVKTYLTPEMLHQEINLEPLLGPFKNKNSTLWQFLLNDWNVAIAGGQVLNGNVGGVTEIIRVLKEHLPVAASSSSSSSSVPQYSIFLQSLKAGNTHLSKLLLESGMTLTAEDRANLIAKPSKKSMETLQALQPSIEDADKLVFVMNENLLKIPEREEKIVASGAVFKRVVDPELVEKFGVDSWEDQTGLIWGDVVKNEDGSKNNMNQDDAEKYCKDRGARLPTRTEFARLKQYFTSGTPAKFAVPLFMFNLSMSWFWSASVHSFISSKAYFFSGDYGYTDDVSRTNPNGSVLCVFGPEAGP